MSFLTLFPPNALYVYWDKINGFFSCVWLLRLSFEEWTNSGNHVLSHALGTPWQLLLLWQKQQQQQSILSNRLALVWGGNRGWKGFSSSTLLSLPLPALAGAGPATFLNQIPSPTPQLNLPLCVQTDVPMLYKTRARGNCLLFLLSQFLFRICLFFYSNDLAMCKNLFDILYFIYCIFSIFFNIVPKTVKSFNWYFSQFFKIFPHNIFVLLKMKRKVSKWFSLSHFPSMLKHLITLKIIIILHPNNITILYIYI